MEAIYGYGKVVDEWYEGRVIVKRADERALAEARRAQGGGAVGGSVKLVLKRLPEEV